MIDYYAIDVFKLLIETIGCDVNALNNNKHTPIHYAIRYCNSIHKGNITVLTYLLTQNDINVNIKGWDGDTLLHWACININNLPIDIFKLLIETHGFDVNAQNNNKYTPLHSALRFFNPHQGDVTVLAYLINQKDVNVNIRGKQGHSFLHLACINTLFPRHPSELKAKCDTFLCQIVEMIAERCVQEVFDEKTPLEATTTI
jgi:ankyrin repeat protein